MKTCTKCKQEKLATGEFFPLHKKTTDGLSSWCRLCNVAYTLQWKLNNKEREKNNLRKGNLRRNYNLSIEDYRIMLNAQDGKCKICKSEEIHSNRVSHFYVDHCHQTNAIRGLLCHNCNYGLGYFKDQIQILQEAIMYLEQHRATIK
jgi:hypothetical protein